MEEKLINIPRMSYNNKCGVYESNSRILYGKLPERGVSSNKYLACFGVMWSIYSDVYARSWGIRSRLLSNNEELKDLFTQYVKSVMGIRFGKFDKFYTDGEYLEESMNKVIRFLIKSKDFEFDRQVFIPEIKVGVSSPKSSLGVSSAKQSKELQVLYFRDIREGTTFKKVFTTIDAVSKYAESVNYKVEKI